MDRKHSDNSVNVPAVTDISKAQEVRKAEGKETQKKSLKKKLDPQIRKQINKGKDFIKDS